MQTRFKNGMNKLAELLENRLTDLKYKIGKISSSKNKTIEKITKTKHILPFMIQAVGSNDINLMLHFCNQIDAFKQRSQRNYQELNAFFQQAPAVKDFYDAIIFINTSYKIDMPFDATREYQKFRPYFINFFLSNALKDEYLFTVVSAILCETNVLLLAYQDQSAYDEIYKAFRELFLSVISAPDVNNVKFATMLKKITQLIPNGDQLIADKIKNDISLIKDIYAQLRPAIIEAYLNDHADPLHTANRLLGNLNNIVPNIDNEIKSAIADDHLLMNLSGNEVNELTPLIKIIQANKGQSFPKSNIDKTERYVQERKANESEFFYRLGPLKITLFGEKFGHPRTKKLDVADHLLALLKNPKEGRHLITLDEHKDVLTSGELKNVYKSCLKK